MEVNVWSVRSLSASLEIMRALDPSRTSVLLSLHATPTPPSADHEHPRWRLSPACPSCVQFLCHHAQNSTQQRLQATQRGPSPSYDVVRNGAIWGTFRQNPLPPAGFRPVRRCEQSNPPATRCIKMHRFASHFGKIPFHTSPVPRPPCRRWKGRGARRAIVKPGNRPYT